MFIVHQYLLLSFQSILHLVLEEVRAQKTTLFARLCIDRFERSSEVTLRKG